MLVKYENNDNRLRLWGGWSRWPTILIPNIFIRGYCQQYVNIAGSRL